MEEGRHDWNINEVTWDRHEMRTEWRGDRSPEQSAGASSAQQVASTSGPTTNESAGEVPIVLDTFAGAGSAKRKLPMQCQVDGCNKDLASEKEYYQRYRICEEHLKLSSLLKDGVQQRFCQQCGRFHVLADFDGDKRSCRARLDLHNNRRRKRGESGSETYRSSARLERRLGEQLHQRISTRSRSRRSARKARSDSSEEEDILTEGSEVERPQGTAEGLSEIGSERRYATRQTTRKQQGSQLGSTEPDKERRMLRDQHLYPPNIAETLAALQRGPESRQPSYSRYSLQDDPMWQAHGGLIPYHESRTWAAADSIMRHLSDPVHSLRDTLQASGSLPNSMMHRNALLMNALSTPSHLPSRQPSASRNSSEFQTEEAQRSARLELLNQLVYLQDLPQLPHMPVSESPYASPSLYKCASDPSSNTDTDRPHMSPAQLAGVHVAQGSLGANPRDAAAMFTYSSEPTAMASSSMVHSAGARLSESQFHDIAWPSPHPMPLHSPEGQREHLSFRQGPSKRFFETAEGLEQGERRRGQELGRTSSRSVGDLPFAISGFPWNLPSSQLPPGPLGSLSQTSSGGLPRSQDEIVAGMQRELSAERGRMGRISLSQSIENMQQGLERQASGSEALQQQPSAYLGTPPPPTNVLERIPEDSATHDAALSPQDLFPGPPGAALLGDMFGIFNPGGMSRSGLLQASPPQELARSSMSLPQRQPQHQAGHGVYLRAGSGSLTNLQALREASQRPWNPSAPVTGGTVTTGAQPGRSAGTHSVPELGGTAWAAYLASPASSAMSPVPASDQPLQWPSSSQRASGVSKGAVSTSPSRSGGQPQPEPPQQLHGQYRFDSASSYYNFPQRPAASIPAGLATEFMPPAPITTGAVPVLSGPQIPLLPMRRPVAEADLGAPSSSGKVEMPTVCQEAARAAWPTIAGAGAPGKAGPELQRTDSARGEPAFQGMRLSAKLGDAGPQELAGSALREGMQRMLGGEGSTPGLQASVRPGCVHLVVDTLTFWDNHMDTVTTITAAADVLVASNPLWSHGRILLQTASHAALLYNGTLCSIWHGEDLEKRVPDIPCAAPFAAATPGDIVLCVRGQTPPELGFGPLRLLVRYKGTFLADKQLRSSSSSSSTKCRKVRVDLDEVNGSGVAWLEAECNGFMSPALPIVLCQDHDIVEELRTLEAEVADGSREWEDVSRMLSDIGLILEYADLLSGRIKPESDCALHEAQLCLKHVAHLARKHMPFICGKGWAALASKVLCVAAVGCSSLAELMKRLGRVMPHDMPTLLHAAARSGSVSMATLLLDLDKHGHTWDLTRADASGQTPLHLAAQLGDEGCMAGLILRHPACSAAGTLWSTLKDASGQTPADLAVSTSKAHPGKIFLLLSPAERAAMSSTNQPKSLGKASCSSLEGSATSSGDLSEDSTQAMWQAPADTASGTGADRAPAGQQCCAWDAELAAITTPFSSFCIDEYPCSLSSSSLERSEVLRQQLRSMHTFTSDCMPETATTAPILSISERALLEDSFMQKSLSADTDGVPHGSRSLREQLRAALVPCLAASACTAMRPTGPLNVALSSCRGERDSLSQQDASAPDASTAAQPPESLSNLTFSPAAAGRDPVRLPEDQADESPPVDRRGSLSLAAFGQGQLGTEEGQVSGRGGAAEAVAVKSFCPGGLAGSGPKGPRATHRSSREDLRQAQAALASFPGHLTESQATAVADVRSRMRDLALESTAKSDTGATSAFSAACSSATPFLPQGGPCSTIQRLSVVVGERRFRSASACPADYCTPGKLPFESASSLSLPDDTFRGLLDAACDADTAGAGAPDGLPPCAAGMHEEDELVTYRERLPAFDWGMLATNRTSECQARAAPDGAAGKQAAAFEAHRLPMRDSAFDTQHSNSSAAAGYAEDPSLPRSSAARKDHPRRQAPLPLTLSWKPWVISAAIVTSCSLVLPSATVLCMVAASLVFIVACNPSRSNPARLPSGTEMPTHDVDALQREAWHKGWRKYLLCFQSNELEREFLELHAGACWSVDMLFSCLLTALAAIQLASSASALSSAASATPWILHLLCTAMPAVLALYRPRWYVRQRETVMIAERLGCQACILFCGLQAASVQHSAEVARSWPGVILAEVVASALQLLHLPVGFQIRTCWHLPLALLTLRLRLRVRQPGTWGRGALTSALMLLPTLFTAFLERRARRCFLTRRLGNSHDTAPVTSTQPCSCQSSCS